MFHPEYRDKLKVLAGEIEEMSKSIPVTYEVNLLRSDEKQECDFDSRYVPGDFVYTGEINKYSSVEREKRRHGEMYANFFLETIEDNKSFMHTGLEAWFSYDPKESQGHYCAQGCSFIRIYSDGSCSSNICTEKYDFYNIYKTTGWRR